MVELPLIGDYTIKIDAPEFPFLHSVADRDSARCETSDAPFVILSHWWAMGAHDNAGYRFWELQFERLRKRSAVQGATLLELSAEYGNRLKKSHRKEVVQDA